MISDKYLLNSEPERMAAARGAAEAFAAQAGLDRRSAMRLYLLVEETLGMVKAMVDDFYGQMWFDGDASACRICLEATADMDSGKKHELLSVSRSGRNAAAKGFMAMIGDVISSAMYGLGRSLDSYGQETIKYGIVHTEGIMAPAVQEMTPVWTLQSYRDNLDSQREESPLASAAWNELEKSVVASLADDVVVGVKGDRVELVITKRFQ